MTWLSGLLYQYHLKVARYSEQVVKDLFKLHRTWYAVEIQRPSQNSWAAFSLPGRLGPAETGQSRNRKMSKGGSCPDPQVRAGASHALRISAPESPGAQESAGSPARWAAGLPGAGTPTVGDCVHESRLVVRGDAAELASSQGLGLRGSSDAVGSPWVAVMWRFSRPGSSWPSWTSCRSCARVTEVWVGSAEAGALLGLPTELRSSMSRHQFNPGPDHKHFRAMWEQPCSRKGGGGSDRTKRSSQPRLDLQNPSCSCQSCRLS